MPKRRRQTLELKRNPLSIATLLVKILLIRIGSIPLFVFKLIFQFPFVIFHSIGQLINRMGNRKLQIVNFHLPRHRGRPKKYGFLSLKNPVVRRKKLFGFGVFLLVLIVYTAISFSIISELPSPTHISNSDHPLTTEFYDRSGKLLYRLYEGRNRSLVTLDQVPKHLIEATIAIEDKNFYRHSGVDPVAIVRALRNNFKHERTEGASTITQQLIKNTLLSPEKTYQRKIKEVVLAFWTERLYSKDQILTMYFNEAPYGGPAWGIKAAAETYFDKQPKDLNLAETSFLAGLPASPTEYSPFGAHPELAKERQKKVLTRMVEDGYITRLEADQAFAEPLNFKEQIVDLKAPHFVMYVKDHLSKKYGAKLVSQGGLKIVTTLDLGLQENVQNIVSDEVGRLSSLNVTNGAAMVTDAKTGQILAMVGSRDYHYPGFGNFNVTTSLRQPGSSIKPVTYATAFKQGFTPGNTILDVPVSFPDGVNRYTPVNYDGSFHGAVSIRTALGSSYNIPAVKLLATVGVDKMIETAKDLGITTLNDRSRYGLSLTLGGGEIKLIDMMGVYGTFSQNGLKHTPTPILKVSDSRGNVLEEYCDCPIQVLQPEIAYLITNILSDNNARTPAFGPNSLLNIPGHTVAVKTGTTDNKRDNWTFGYTPEFVVGVWVGNNNNAPMHPSLTSGVTGAAPIWNKITRGVLATRENVAFSKPSGIIEVGVDGRKDLAVAGILPKALVRIAQNQDKTTFFDAFTVYATSSAQAAAGHQPN